MTIELIAPGPDVVEYLKGVIGVVDANSFENMSLWQQNQIRDNQRTWEESRSGYLVTVGQMGDRPVCLSISYATIDGHKILFIDACSEVVDYAMVEEWLKKYLPETAWTERFSGKYINRTNAMNFHNVFPR